MRTVVWFGALAAIVCVPANAVHAQRCVRWIASGAVGATALFVAPPVEPFPSSRLSVVQPASRETPWREYRFDGLSSRFFEGTASHRSIAKVVNRAAADDETDATLKSRMNGDAEFLTLDLRSIVLRRRDDGLQFGWVTATQEAVFPKRVTIETFESGERLELKGTFVRKGRLGEAVGTMTLVVRFDLRTQRLIVERATCRLSVSSIVGKVEDEATLGPAEAGEGEAERLPQRVLE